MTELIIIDDNSLLLHTLGQFFERTRHRTRLAANGHEAFTLMRQQPADLAVIDLIMPDIEGIEIIRNLRHHFPATKIIAMSGGGFGDASGYLKIASELGAHRTLTKPFQPQQLLNLVEELLPPPMPAGSATPPTDGSRFNAAVQPPPL